MIVEAACYATLLVRLWFVGLASRYRFLSLWLVIEVIEGAGLALIPLRSYAYTYTYMSVVPIWWVLSYLVVLELCRLILEDYPGIAAAGNLIVKWTMGATALISVAIAAWGLLAGIGRYPFMRSFQIIHLSVRVGLFVFQMAILFFVFRFRLRLPLNRRLYGIGFALCWGLGSAADGVTRLMSANIAEVAYIFEMLLTSALLLVGAFLLTPAGERRIAPIGPESEEERTGLHRKLSEMNQVLLRTRMARKKNP